MQELCSDNFKGYGLSCIYNSAQYLWNCPQNFKADILLSEKETKMRKNLRQKMVKAMEFMVKSVNDEDLLNSWLMVGVADGDIRYSDLELSDDFDEYYIEDREFKNLMSVFLKTMNRAWNNGGLYCDGIVSCDKTDYHLE